MREVGPLPTEEDAKRLVGTLIAEDIPARYDDEDGQWVVWIRDEDTLGEAQRLYGEYLENPQATRFDIAQPPQEDVEARLDEAEERVAEHTASRSQRRPRLGTSLKTTPLVSSVMFSVLLVGVLSIAADPPIDSLNYIIRRQMQFANPAEHMATQDQLASIKRGELWRMVTPVFLHNDPILLFCNVIVWLSLAGMLERALGSRKLAMLCLVIAIIANFAQALSPLTMGGGIQFGGLAPVVMGLFGYAWVKSRVDAAAGIVVSAGTILFVMVYLWICFSSEHVANIGLTFGLFAGVSIALLAPPTEQV